MLSARAVILTTALLFSNEPATEPQRIQLDIGTKGGRCVGTDLDKSLEKWVGVLRMQDWILEVRCGMPEQLAQKSYVGFTMYNPITRKGIMFINPDERMKEPRDIVVLHELLHPLLNNSSSAKSEFVEEQLVQLLTTIIAKKDHGYPCPDHKEEKP